MAVLRADYDTIERGEGFFQLEPGQAAPVKHPLTGEAMKPKPPDGPEGAMALSVRSLSKSYPTRGEPLSVLQNVNLSMNSGEALVGTGSEVLGYDTERSTDHDWGPRLQVFLSPSDVDSRGADLAGHLPATFLGYPTIGVTVKVPRGPKPRPTALMRIVAMPCWAMVATKPSGSPCLDSPPP